MRRDSGKDDRTASRRASGPAVATPSAATAERLAWLEVIRALARQAARADHDAEPDTHRE